MLYFAHVIILQNCKSVKIEKLSAYSTNDYILQNLEVFFLQQFFIFFFYVE